jgi:hypothetical protein
MELANDTIRKAEIRKRIGMIIFNALVAEFGEDFVRYLPYDIYVNEGGSKIAGGTIIADVGDVLNRDKMTMGALAEINIKSKQWNDTKTANTDRQAITLDDVDVAMAIAEELAKSKAEKNAKAEEKKKERISKTKGGKN